MSKALFKEEEDDVGVNGQLRPSHISMFISTPNDLLLSTNAAMLKKAHGICF